MPNPEDKSYIEELKKSLYSRTAPDVRTRRKLRFSDTNKSVPTNWDKQTSEAGHSGDSVGPPLKLNQNYENHRMSFFTKLLIYSGTFCLIAVGVGGYLFLNGANLISANNISIDINGPVSIAGGEPVSFDIRVSNQNNIDLRIVDLSIDFPAGATDPNDPTKELRNFREFLGDIPAGESKTKTVSAIIFGEENLQKQIFVTVTYSIKGSSSVFSKTQTHEVLINSSPINMTISSFKEITSGQEFDTEVRLKSNSKETLKNVILKVAYPFGYILSSSNPVSLSDKTTWKVGDIPPGAERRVIIHGKITGEDNDTRVFHFTVGAQSSSDSSVIGTQYMTTEQDIVIQKPFISLKVAVDNDSSPDDFIAQAGQSRRVEIAWFNNLPTTVSNVTVTAKLSGSAYDKTLVSPDQGYFDSSKDEIVWSRQTNSELGSVSAGDTGTVSFTITPKDVSVGNTISNPSLAITASVSGSRTQETNVPQTIAAVVTKNIKISSNISLSGRVVRTTGPFVNSGFVPPKIDQPTTYTVIWNVDNASNIVNNSQVTATLPPYVEWLSMTSPANENISFDKDSGKITWNVGSVGIYTLSSSRRREVMFQVSFKPNVNQVGQSPVIVNSAVLTATDNFTGASLQDGQDSLTTRFSTDPSYKSGDEVVGK